MRQELEAHPYNIWYLYGDPLARGRDSLCADSHLLLFFFFFFFFSFFFFSVDNFSLLHRSRLFQEYGMPLLKYF